jgi:peptide deformylase
MAILNILHFPDPRLRQIAQPVPAVNDSIRQHLADMFETMYQAPGVGLAAPQVNLGWRMLVIDVSEERNQPLCLINPEILATAGQKKHEEGCLSVPGIFDTVERADWVKVRALNQQGESFVLEAEGLLAVCIQHEIDHLDGKLFVDYLSTLKRQRLRNKIEKQRRETM